MKSKFGKTIKDTLTEYLSTIDRPVEDDLGAWLKAKWDESKHKRDSGGKFSTSKKTIEKQDDLDPNASNEENQEKKKWFEATEEGVAQELAYESVEEFRADKENYKRFLESIPRRWNKHNDTRLF